MRKANSGYPFQISYNWNLGQRTAIFVGRLGRIATIFVGSFLGLMTLGVGFVEAENYDIKGTVFTTNGGHIIDGNDRLRISRSGEVDIVDVDGVELTGQTNKLINHGRISASGGFAQGVQSGSGNKIINRGNINANGGFAQGINGVDNNRITNTGYISVSGGFAQGINLETANNFVTSGNIQTNGGFSQGIHAERGNKISNKGVITTEGGFARGVNLEELNVFVSSGNIITSGGSAHGVYADEGNTIDNKGAITTEGGYAQGIYVGRSNTVKNSGSISTNGGFAQGVYAQSDNRITNSGDINTEAGFAQGIFAQDSNYINNRGSILTQGKYAQGVQLEDNNTVNNTGLINTTGDFAQAIQMGDNNKLVNNGTIQASGGFAQAIRAGDNNVITNSGTISSSGENAIELGDSNTLNINRGSQIIGGIDVGTNATVNIQSDTTQSVLWDFSENDNTTIAVETPEKTNVFYNRSTKKLATYNSTAVASSSNQTAEFTAALGGIAQQRLDLAFAVAGQDANSFDTQDNTNFSANSYVETQEQAFSSRIDRAFGKAAGKPGGVKKPAFKDQTRKLWASLFGGITQYEAQIDADVRETQHWGLAAGIDWYGKTDHALGLMIGYNQGRLTAQNQLSIIQDNQSEGLFTAFYGRKKIAANHIDFTITGGINRHTDMRFINDNLAENGIAAATANYDSYWISPYVKFGSELPAPNNWVHIPSIGIRYTSQWLNGYSETGTNANATVSSRHIANLEPGLEWAAKKTTQYGWAKFRLGYLYRLALGETSSKVTILDQTNEITATTRNQHIGYFGINSNFALTDNLNLELGGKVTISDDSTGYDGKVRLIRKF